MGPLTADMTRLCQEIVAGRGARQSFVKDLRLEVTAMKATFRQAHADMAREAKAERLKSCANLKQTVASLKAEFRRHHLQMARKTRAERLASVSHLKATVAGLRREFALDLKGAHRAWFGPTPAELKAMEEAKRQAREEAERRQAEAKAREEADAKAREEADAKAREEAERQAKEAAESRPISHGPKSKEEGERRAGGKKKGEGHK